MAEMVKIVEVRLGNWKYVFLDKPIPDSSVFAPSSEKSVILDVLNSNSGIQVQMLLKEMN